MSGYTNDFVRSHPPVITTGVLTEALQLRDVGQKVRGVLDAVAGRLGSRPRVTRASGEAGVRRSTFAGCDLMTTLSAPRSRGIARVQQ